MSLIPGFIKKPIGCILTLVVGLFLILLVLGVVGGLIVDHFALDIAAHEIHQRSGFVLTAEKQNINVFAGSADVQGLKLENPERFAAKDFVRFNELKGSVEIGALLKRQIVVDEVVVDLDTLAVVQDKDGEYNFAALQKSLLGGGAATGGGKASGLSIPPFTIKKFTLRIHQAKYFNFKTGDGTPKIYDVNYDRTFTDVNEKNLTSVEVAIGTDLAGHGFSVFLDVLKDQVLDPDTYLNAVKGIGNLAGNAAGAVLDGVGNAAKGAGDLLKKIIP